MFFSGLIFSQKGLQKMYSYLCISQLKGNLAKKEKLIFRTSSEVSTRETRYDWFLPLVRTTSLRRDTFIQYPPSLRLQGTNSLGRIFLAKKLLKSQDNCLENNV